MMNKINSVIRFLQAARKLAKQGMSKEQILDFARREFGKISELLRRQIDDIYSRYKKPKTEKKGEVVPIKKDEGIETLSEADKDIADIQKSIDDLDETVKEADAFSESIGFPKNPYRPGGALDPVEGLTRTLARRILNKKGVKIDRRDDPLDVFSQKYSGYVLTDVKNLAEDILEAEKQGRQLKSMDELLDIEGLFNVKPIKENPYFIDNPDVNPQGIPDEEFSKIVDKVESEKLISKVGKEFQLDVEKFAKEFPVSKEEALRISKLPSTEQQKILQKYIDEDFKQKVQLSDFDVTGRDPNAGGGLINILKL